MSSDLIDFLENNPNANKEIRVDFTDSITGKPFSAPLALGWLWILYDTVHFVGEESRLLLIASLGAQIGTLKLGFDKADVQIVETMNNMFRQMLSQFPVFENPAFLEDRLLAFTYALLKQKKITYAEAAQLVSAVLDTEINADAWRMRLTRWIEKRGLEKNWTAQAAAHYERKG